MKTSLLACGLALVFSSSALLGSEVPYEKPAKNTFKKSSSVIVTSHRSDVRKTRAWLRKSLKVLRGDLASGEVRPAEASAALGAISSKWFERMRDATSAALADLEDAAVDRLAATGGISTAPSIQLGSKGTLDVALQRIDQSHDIAVRDARTRLGVLARRVRDSYGHPVSVSIAELPRALVVPNLGSNTAPRPTPSLDRVVGDGGEPELGDGLLKIAGWIPDDTMTLTLRVERGAFVLPPIAIETPADGGAWFVAVSDLNAGNWRVTLLRDGVPTATLIAAVAD